MGVGATTCWTMIHAAAHGGEAERDAFAQRYLPVVSAYLVARWRASPLRTEVDDAVQEVFVECYREGGVLEKADPARPGGFRAFLFGVVRNVARRVETRRPREHQARTDVEPATDENEWELEFDRAWARGIMRQAAELQASQASDDDARQRVELLRLRFQEDLPIREIASRWNADAQKLHYAYSKARKEFEAALHEVVSFHNPGAPDAVRRECEALIGLL